MDDDAVPDLFFGAPGSTLNNTTIVNGVRPLAGAAYVIEGALIGGTSSGSTTTTTTGGNATSFNAVVNTLPPIIFTGNDFGLASPPVSALSHLISYAPLPVQVAEQQFRPQPGFLARQNVSQHPSQRKGTHQAPAGTVETVKAITGSENKYTKVNTLRPGVFKRGKTKVGKKNTFTHKVKVIPASQQTETYPG